MRDKKEINPFWVKYKRNIEDTKRLYSLKTNSNKKETAAI